jgi:hypothetical protein
MVPTKPTTAGLKTRSAPHRLRQPVLALQQRPPCRLCDRQVWGVEQVHQQGQDAQVAQGVRHHRVPGGQQGQRSGRGGLQHSNIMSAGLSAQWSAQGGLQRHGTWSPGDKPHLHRGCAVIPQQARQGPNTATAPDQGPVTARRPWTQVRTQGLSRLDRGCAGPYPWHQHVKR